MSTACQIWGTVMDTKCSLIQSEIQNLLDEELENEISPVRRNVIQKCKILVDLGIYAVVERYGYV